MVWKSWSTLKYSLPPAPPPRQPAAQPSWVSRDGASRFALQVRHVEGVLRVPVWHSACARVRVIAEVKHIAAYPALLLLPPMDAERRSFCTALVPPSKCCTAEARFKRSRHSRDDRLPPRYLEFLLERFKLGLAALHGGRAASDAQTHTQTCSAADDGVASGRRDRPQAVPLAARCGRAGRGGARPRCALTPVITGRTGGGDSGGGTHRSALNSTMVKSRTFLRKRTRSAPPFVKVPPGKPGARASARG
jgi:hypothetical protein